MTLTQWFEREGVTGLDKRAKRIGLPRTTVWRLTKPGHVPDLRTIRHITRKTGGLVRFEDFAGAM